MASSASLNTVSASSLLQRSASFPGKTLGKIALQNLPRAGSLPEQLSNCNLCLKASMMEFP